MPGRRPSGDWADKAFVMEQVKKRGLNLKFASEKLKADKEVVLAAFPSDARALKYASKELQADKNVVLVAVNSDANALKYASKELQADKEVVLVAVKNDEDALQYASKELQADREVLTATVSDYDDLAFATMGFDSIESSFRALYADSQREPLVSARTWANKAFVLEQLKYRATDLQFASKELKADKEVVLAAVRSDASALQFASEELKADKEVVLAAVKRDKIALQFASKELLYDKEILDAQNSVFSFSSITPSDNLPQRKESPKDTSSGATSSPASHQALHKRSNEKNVPDNMGNSPSKRLKTTSDVVNQGDQANMSLLMKRKKQNDDDIKSLIRQKRLKKLGQESTENNNRGEENKQLQDVNMFESGILEFRTNDQSKTSLHMKSIREVNHIGLPIGTPVSLKESKFICSHFEKETELVRIFEDSKPSADDSRIAKGTHSYMTTSSEDNNYSVRVNAHQVTNSGKAGTKIENFDLVRDDFMFTVELSRSHAPRGQDVRHAGGYVDFAIEMHASGKGIHKVPGLEFAYDIGDGLRMDLTNCYFESLGSGDGFEQRMMPKGFPKLKVDANDSSKCTVTFRFHRIEASGEIFYDPWFRSRHNRQGRFDVVSKLHPYPVPVNFGKDWPVSVTDPIVDAIEVARRKVYAEPRVGLEDLIYNISMNGNEVMTFNGGEAMDGHPNIMNLLDRANSWEDGAVFKVTISEPPPKGRLTPIRALLNQSKCAQTNYLQREYSCDQHFCVEDLEVGCTGNSLLAVGLDTKNEMGKLDCRVYTGDIISFEAPKRFWKSYQWDFGDGTRTDELISHKTTHKFEEAGSYEVSLTAHDDSNHQKFNITTHVTVQDSKFQRILSSWPWITGAAFAVVEILNVFGVLESKD